LITGGANVPESLFDVLVDESILPDDEDYRKDFIDCYERNHS